MYLTLWIIFGMCTALVPAENNSTFKNFGNKCKNELLISTFQGWRLQFLHDWDFVTTLRLSRHNFLTAEIIAIVSIGRRQHMLKCVQACSSYISIVISAEYSNILSGYKAKEEEYIHNSNRGSLHTSKPFYSLSTPSNVTLSLRAHYLPHDKCYFYSSHGDR